jgi:copper oxidase (laccase) domain-containing protein
MTHTYALPEGFHAATSTRADGNMDFRFGTKEAVTAARTALCASHAFTGACAVMSVVHGDSCISVDTETDITLPLLCDALITTQKNVGLLLLTADCIPLIFIDTQAQMIGLAHLGWKPTALSLARKVVDAMSARGASPASLHVYAGPGIHQASYLTESPSQKDDPVWQPYLTHMHDDIYAVDLYTKNYDELITAGIPAAHLHFDAPDTAADAAYFSHYRSTRTGEAPGRIATLVFQTR